MRNLFVTLVLATVGFAPAFANEAATTKVEPKKAEEVQAKPVAPEAKQDKAAHTLLVGCPCGTEKPETKEQPKEEQAQTTKPAPAPKTV
jgi:hypothetical protein